MHGWMLTHLRRCSPLKLHDSVRPNNKANMQEDPRSQYTDLPMTSEKEKIQTIFLLNKRPIDLDRGRKHQGDLKIKIANLIGSPR